MSSVGELAYDTNQTTAKGNEAQYALVVQQSFFAPTPGIPTVGYMNSLLSGTHSLTVANESPHDPADSFGCNIAYVMRYQPGWLLRQVTTNAYLRTTDFNNMYVPDPGNNLFYQTWCRFVYERLKYMGFSGVWIDDANLTPGHGVNGQVKKYTDVQYGDAMADFLCYAGDYFTSRGMQAWCNLACNPWDSVQLAQAIRVAGSGMNINREHWCRYGDIAGPFTELFNDTANNGTPPISSLLDYATQIQSAGALISGVDYGHSPADSADQAAMTYGRALFLLAWDGRAGSFYAYRPAGVVDPATDPRWMVDIGTPTGAYTIQTDGTYLRNFTGGHVTLNPHRGQQTAQIVAS